MAEGTTLLRESYQALAALVRGLDDDASWGPTACTGWAARDLVHHCLGDAQRALVALHTPADAPADRDAVSYWADAGAASGDDGRTPEQAAADGRRHTRVVASMFRDWPPLQALHLETSAAVVRAAGTTDPRARVRTQGHVLRVDDLLSTLAVEVTLHHLDLLVGRPDGPGPAPSGLAEVRRVLDALAGAAAPASMTDERWALVGTGRAEPTGDERAALADVVARLPLLS